MAIDRFSREQFESALPRDKQTGNPLWRSMGNISGEFEYALSVKPGIDILVRSSVRPDGRAAEAAKDSIRAWIVDAENHAPLGSKLQAWITRVPGCRFEEGECTSLTSIPGTVTVTALLPWVVEFIGWCMVGKNGPARASAGPSPPRPCWNGG